jgi:hypothetical protein
MNAGFVDAFVGSTFETKQTESYDNMTRVWFGLMLFGSFQKLRKLYLSNKLFS